MKTINWKEVWKRAGWTFAEALFGAVVGVLAYLSSLPLDQKGAIIVAVLTATVAAVGKNVFTEKTEA